MTRLVLAMFMSLDGYVAGPNGEFVPPPWSAEVGEVWANRNSEERWPPDLRPGQLRVQQGTLDVACGGRPARDRGDEPAAQDGGFPIAVR